MAKHSLSDASKQTHSKTDARYWKGRLFRSRYSRNGQHVEVHDWCARVAHGGRRETVNLRTPNETAAASKAAAFYKTLISQGWDAALALYRPKPEKAPKCETIGEYIEAALKVCEAAEPTQWLYARSLRRIAGDVAGLEGSGRAKAKVAAIDALPLSVLSSKAVEQWRVARLKGVDDPVKARKVKSFTNSILSNAKALFTKEILERLPATVVLPSPLPLDGVKKFERQSVRYQSKVDAETLIATAREELGKNADELETWKAFCVTMFPGLRKGEADKLRWESVDLAKGVIRVETHQHFTAKSEDSLDSIDLDPDFVELLRGWREKDPKGEYVLKSDTAPRRNDSGYHYRCKQTFDRLAEWLRTKGITAQKAIHELRKEAGSLVNARHGIHAASRFLRHADIAVTAAHYLAQKGKVTIGVSLSDKEIKQNKALADVDPDTVRKVLEALLKNSK